jgi:hypothetical protein
MLRLAIGPASEFPSWQWVGADTARELAKYFDVSLFDSFKRIPTCDAVVIVKHRPPLRLARLLRETGVKVIFAPIDLYAGHAEIHRDMTLLEGCDLVLSHSELLLQHFQPHCKRVAHIEHHAKYTLPELAAYRPDGYVLWIGGLQYAPYLLDWLARHPVRREVKILTDSGNRQAAHRARSLARRLGLRLDIRPHSINGYEMRAWSEAEQQRMMQDCKAAIDIKGDDFNQLTKPPTKGQKFVSSGIAFACNSETATSRYFRERGLDLACPLDEDWWFSRDYWQQTCRFAGELRERISIESVGLCFRSELQCLWSSGSP